MKVSSISLNCFKLEEMKTFYALLGAEFESFQVTLGSQGYRAYLTGLEVKLIPATSSSFSGILNDKQKLSIPVYQMSLIVSEVRTLLAKIQSQFPTAVLSDLITDAAGTFVLMEDPQGNKVQLVEKK